MQQKPILARLTRKRVFVPACVGLVLFGAFVWFSFPQMLRAIQPSCTIGLSGTAAQVTIIGWMAPFDCDAITKGEAASLFDESSNSGKKADAYLVTQGTSGAVICEVDLRGRHVIVRYQGSFAFTYY